MPRRSSEAYPRRAQGSGSRVCRNIDSGRNLLVRRRQQCRPPIPHTSLPERARKSGRSPVRLLPPSDSCPGGAGIAPGPGGGLRSISTAAARKSLPSAALIRTSGESGLVFSGCNVWPNSSRIEGRFLAIAGRLSNHRVVRVLLVGEIAAQLAADQPEKLLETGYLLIPDLEMWSAVFGSDRPVTYRLVEALKERERQRLPTIVYAEDGPELEPGIASILDYRYRRVDLSKVTPIEDLSDSI